jgi:heavy metal sensor kinase
MSSAKSRTFRLGLRARLTLAMAGVLALTLAVGFAWVHHGLRAVLEAKNDAFLERKGAELVAVLRDEQAGGQEALEAEIRREVAAYGAEGLIVIVRRGGQVLVAPAIDAAERLAGRLAASAVGATPTTLTVAGPARTLRYRTTRIVVTPASPRGTDAGSGTNPGIMLELGLSLAETEAILAQFDRRAAAGGLAFLALAACGGLLFAHQALRPVAQSIRTARRLNPADLSARLPRTGAGDELDQLAGTINDLLDRLANYHAQVARFTADASHELRSPLGAMRAAVEVALQQPRTALEYRDILGSLGEQCERLTALVNGLLLLARADAGQVELGHEPIDLAVLVAEVGEMYQPLAEEREITLTCNGPATLGVAGDPARLRQLLINLVDNAIKFTEPGGRVAVRAERAGAAGERESQARLVIADTGVGIAPEHLSHVFERFYQADPARSAGGSGLGLSICQWIAQVHGGSIHAASTPGRGSTFTVLLPAAPAPVPVVRTPAAG